MTAAMRRLDDLLQDASPRRPTKTGKTRANDDVDPIDDFEADAGDLPGELNAVAREEDAAEDDFGSVRPLIEHPPVEGASAKRPGRGRETPSARTAKKPELKIELPPGMRPGIKKPTSPSGGLFGFFLSRLLGAQDSEFKAAVSASRRALSATLLFSAVINVLMMAGPLFMLQVYDRVLPSGSFSTLVALSIVTAAIYCIVGVLELTRTRIISRVGAEIDQRLSDRVFESSLRKSLVKQGAAGATMRELDNLRQFLSGPSPITFFDIAWTPAYLLVIFLAHWTLGVAAIIGTVVLVGLAWLSKQRGRTPLLHARQAVSKSLELAEAGQRNAEAITAMGMMAAYRARWQTVNSEALGWQLLASDRLGGLLSATKAASLLLQALMLAMASGLAISGQISPGAVIAVVMVFGRALAPFEVVMRHRRSFISARESSVKLDEALTGAPIERNHTGLPRPKGVLEVENIRVAAPETRNAILHGISFKLSPGQMLAIIGPSASGKSSLIRAIMGLWPPFGGTITVDDTRLDRWHPEDLGQYIGYLPQSVELFSGTVRENIARFRDDATGGQVIEAAKQAHVHELILDLPDGYETELGNDGMILSRGQCQSIALARALFGRPPLVVLDEPYSNLDSFGDEAFSKTLDGLRQRKQTVIIVSHRTQAIEKADLLLLIGKGQQRAFGPSIEIMKMCDDEQPVSGSAKAPVAPPTSQSANAKPPPSEKRRPRRKRDAP